MNDLYWVLAAALVAWIGLFAYLLFVEKRVRDLEERLPQRRGERGQDEPGRHLRGRFQVGVQPRAGRAPARVPADRLGRCAREEEAFELAAAHSTPPAARASVWKAPAEPRRSCRSRIRRATSARARKSRDLTVPSGSSSILPISS